MNKLRLVLAFCLSLSFIQTSWSNNMMSNWRWRNDDGNQQNATWKAGLDTAIILSNLNAPIRVRISLDYYSGVTNDSVKLYYVSNGDTVQISNDQSNEFAFSRSPYFSNGDPAVQLFSDTYTFTGGYMVDSSDSIFLQLLNGTGACSFEMEYCIKPTANFKNNLEYDIFPMSSAGIVVLSPIKLITQKVSPLLSWETPSVLLYQNDTVGGQIVYAQADNNPLLTSMFNYAIAGNMSYNPPLGTILPAGNQTITAFFTPSDTTLFDTISTTTMVTVLPDTIKVSYAQVSNKVYDGTTYDTVYNGSMGVLIGDSMAYSVQGNDTVNLVQGYGNFATDIAGSGIPVTLNGFALTGPQAGNYVILQPAGDTASILPRALVIAANPASKQEGTEDPTLSYSIIGGSLVSGDELTGSITRQPGDTIGEYGIEQGTLTAGSNYTVIFDTAVFTIDVNTVVKVANKFAPSVYPNPTRGPISVDISSGKVSITDLQGNILLETTLPSNKLIDLSGYSSGIYFMQVKTDQGIFSYKVIKQ